MATRPYRYSARPTRNPLRYLIALWRVTRDLSRTDEAAIVEIGFARSRLGRRFAGFDRLAAALRADPRTAPLLERRSPLPALDLERLAASPPGSLGRVFAEHCRARGLDPNLVRVPADSDADFVMAHLFATHDLWHVSTGWGNDETGEVGLGGFYLAQLELPFFAFLAAFIFLNTVFVRPETLRERMDALVAGYRMGRHAEPLFGVEWSAAWNEPLAELRARLRLDPSAVVGEGVRAAA